MEKNDCGPHCESGEERLGMDSQVWFDSLEARANDALPAYASDYFNGSAEGGESNADAQRDWDGVRFAPRAFPTTSNHPTRTTVLGTPIETPILVAPMGQQNAAHPEAERAPARGAAKAGSLIGVSTITSVPFAEIAETGAPWWFQLYLLRDPELTWALVDRAVAADARAIMLTVDLPTLTPDGRVTDPTAGWPDVPGRHRLSNLTDAERSAAQASDGMDLGSGIAPEIIEEIRNRSGLEVIVKGIVRPEDARTAVDAGASGIVVSTHGGRRIGRSVGALRALRPVVDAVGDDAEVYVDSGIRRGDHIAAALALGARAVFVGRPVLWALAADGPEGPERVLAHLTDELEVSLRRLGAGSVHDLSPDMVVLPDHRS